MNYENIETFVWYGDQRSKIFPIDYTIQELATQLDPAKSPTASKRPIRLAVTATQLQSALQNLCLSVDEDLNGFSIPLEAVPLLVCIVELAQQKTYSKVFTSDFSDNADLWAQFVDELCLKLYKDTEMSEDSAAKYIDSSFVHHILFQNTRFLECITAKLWKDEITARFLEIQSLAKQRRLGSQLDSFIDCLTALDRCILKLKSQPHSTLLDEKDTGKKIPEFQPMLYQFLSARNPDSPIGSDAKIRYYKVKNITVGNQTMSEVFPQLQKPPKNLPLQNLARKRYLEDIAQSLESQESWEVQQAQNAERLYADVLHYLELTSTNMSKSELQVIIEKRCIYQCGLVIDYCTFSGSGKIPPLFSKHNYTTTLLDRLIQEEMNSKLNQFQETIQLMAFYSAVASGSYKQRQNCEVRLEQYLLLAGKSPEVSISDVLDRPMKVQTAEENPYYKEICNFLRFFERAWAFLHNIDAQDLEIFDKKNKLFVDTESLARELVCIGTRAAAKFDRQDLMAPVLKEICASLHCYEWYIHDLKVVYPIYRYHHTISRLFLVILLAVLYRIVQDVGKSLPDKLALLPGVDS